MRGKDADETGNENSKEKRRKRKGASKEEEQQSSRSNQFVALTQSEPHHNTGLVRSKANTSLFFTLSLARSRDIASGNASAIHARVLS